MMDTVQNPLLELLAEYRRGLRPVFNLGPFLPVAMMQQKGLGLNEILQKPEALATAAQLNFELGFEATILPYDINVEAEVLGAEIRYYNSCDGIPVYPTIVDKWVSTVSDLVIPNNLETQGRLPVIGSALAEIKQKKAAEGIVGMFIPGPFTLAGQVMDLDEMFIMVLKKPENLSKILLKLADFIKEIRDFYVSAGADFIVLEEGGATSISPGMFQNLVLPGLKDILKQKDVPHVLSMTGSANHFLELMIECQADGFGIDQECDNRQARKLIPENLPLFTVCGDYSMLSKATPEEVAAKVKTTLDMGFTGVVPPVDIYPPAKLENITAFIQAAGNYCPDAL
jgi:[methyl-Co(III) methanol-specific corrinoid protein]:coenzyme M methyltransferase